MSGWIRIQRDVFDHDLFSDDDSPMSKCEAWMWLIAKAAWKDTRHRIGLQMHFVPRGCLFVTHRELQNAWRWGSLTKVQNFLKVLKNEAMIIHETKSGKSKVTICNYDKYQDMEVTERSGESQEKVTKETNKQINNKNIDNTHYVRIADSTIEKPKKSKYSEPEQSLIDAGVSEQSLSDWKKVRKGKPITKTVVSMVAEQARIAKITIAEAIKISAGNSWTGFKADWLLNKNTTQQPKFTTRSVIDELRGFTNDTRTENRFDDQPYIDAAAILREIKPHH
jgi:hypothetical protein